MTVYVRVQTSITGLIIINLSPKLVKHQVEE